MQPERGNTIMAINPQVQALFTLLGISANPNEITGLNTQALETLVGGAGSDYILGQAGLLDTLNGNGGNDYLEGGAGIDAINGGAGIDTAGYANASNGVTVLMTVNGVGTAVGGDGLADTLTGIENVVGSNFNDTITGDNLANVLAGLDGNDTLNGGGGNDTLIGGAGADVLNGGAGIDTANYSTATGRVVLNLTTTARSVGDALGDTFTGIETVIGTNFDDIMQTGGTGSFTLNGGNGADRLASAGTGSCVLVGGAGHDLLFGDAAAASSDTFKFLAPTDFAAGDEIVYVLQNDKIDLSAIDADPNTPGDQAFHIGSGVGGIHISELDRITFEGFTGYIDVSINPVFPPPPNPPHLNENYFIF